MEKLPHEIHCEIISHLDTSSLLTCRLVSRYWDQIVVAHLARVTHVKLNQNALDDSPIPNILAGQLVEISFKCRKKFHEQFFPFIAKKCPRLKVFSANTERIELEHFFELPKGLVFFETNFSGESNREHFSRFTALKASDGDFCTSCHLNSEVQAANICRDPHHLREENRHRTTFTAENLKSLRWYDYLIGERNQPVELPVCLSLEILRVNFYECGLQNARPFFYPNLKYLKCSYLHEDLGPLLNSIRHSTQLRAIEVGGVRDGKRFLDFTATLEHLQFLKVEWLQSTEEIVPVTLTDKLKYLYIETMTLGTNNSIVFSDQRNDQLKFLRLKCKNNSPIVCNFPFLQEVSFSFDYSVKSSLDKIDSLSNSRHLKRLHLDFNSWWCTNEQARKIVKLVSDLNQLNHVLVKGMMESWKETDPIVLDISRHHDLHFLLLNFSQYWSDHPPNFEVIIGQLNYDQLSSGLIMKNKLNYRMLELDITACPVVLLPKLSGSNELQAIDSLPFGEIQMDLHKSTRPITKQTFGKLISYSAKLKKLSLVVNSTFKLTLDDTKMFLDEIWKTPTLESLDLDLFVVLGRYRRSNDKVVLDARELSSLQKLNVKLQSESIEIRYIRVVLMLGDFYRSLAFEGENSIRGELTKGPTFDFLLQNHSEVELSEPMNKLQSLFITHSEMIKDTNRFFTACVSIESLHLNNGDDVRSMIPLFTQLSHLKKLSGKLSHRFLKMFLTRFKQNRKLNLPSSLKSTVEKIREKTSLFPLNISWFDCARDE